MQYADTPPFQKANGQGRDVLPPTTCDPRTCFLSVGRHIDLSADFLLQEDPCIPPDSKNDATGRERGRDRKRDTDKGREKERKREEKVSVGLFSTPVQLALLMGMYAYTHVKM